MLRVHLRDRRHETVLTTTLILAVEDAPEAIVWCDRVFLLATPEKVPSRVYLETTSWTIASPTAKESR